MPYDPNMSPAYRGTARSGALLSCVLCALLLPSVAPADVQLLRLAGDTVDVMYSPGTLDRAAHVQRRLEVMAEDLRKWTQYPIHLTVYCLTRSDWEEANAGPYYGIPGRVTGDGIAIAAEGDLELAALWTRLLGHPPQPLPGSPLTGPPEGADALAATDLLLQLEGAAAMLRQTGWTADTPVAMRLAIHLAAWEVLAIREPSRVQEVGRFFSDLERWPTRLETNPGSMTLEEWVSYEANFYRGAKVLSGSDGKAARKLAKLAIKNGGVVSLEPLAKKKAVREQFEAWSRAWAKAPQSQSRSQ